MENNLKIKIFIGTFYALIVLAVVVAFFYFGQGTFLSTEYLIANKKHIYELRDQYFSSIAIVYFFFAILWFFLLGFGTPLVIFAGFSIGVMWGSILTTLSLAIGTSLLYLFANYFFKNFIVEYLNKHYPKIKKNINENEFSYYFFIRVIPGIPAQVKGLLPVLFDMKVKNVFWATLLGEAIPIAIAVNIVGGFANAIQADKELNFNLLFSPEIFFPLLALGLMVIITNFFIKKRYIKK